MQAQAHTSSAAPNQGFVRDETWLQQKFAAAGAAAALIPGDTRDQRQPEAARPASVLMPLIRREDSLMLLLTRRTAHLYDHAGQISFPGGRAEEDESPIATALREAQEEIGLPAGHVQVLGMLPEYLTVTGYRVTPVVGLVQPFEPKLDDFEVAELFEVPLEFVLNPANHVRNSVLQEGILRHYYALPYGQYYIWGATAAMLINFHAFLSQ